MYNLTGINQTVGQSGLKNVKATYYVHVQNNGNVPETFTLNGTPAPAGWTVDYKDYGTGTIITGAVTGAGWTTPVVNIGAVLTVAVYVTPGATVTGSAVATQTMTVTSNGDTAKKDVGVMNTTLPVLHRPDLSLRPSTGSSYIGVGMYNLDGTNQTVSLSAANGTAANYNIQVQNNGNVPETFTVTSPTAPAGWDSHVYVRNDSYHRCGDQHRVEYPIIESRGDSIDHGRYHTRYHPFEWRRPGTEDDGHLQREWDHTGCRSDEDHSTGSTPAGPVTAPIHSDDVYRNGSL